MKVNKEDGFTLIELMIVVLIIAIIIAIAIPVFHRARESSWLSTCKANLRTVDGSINTFGVSEISYPETGFGTASGEPLHDGHPLVVRGYLKKAPVCPKAVAMGFADQTPLADDGSDDESYVILKTGSEATVVAIYKTQCINFYDDSDNPHSIY